MEKQEEIKFCAVPRTEKEIKENIKRLEKEVKRLRKSNAKARQKRIQEKRNSK